MQARAILFRIPKRDAELFFQTLNRLDEGSNAFVGTGLRRQINSLPPNHSVDPFHRFNQNGHCALRLRS